MNEESTQTTSNAGKGFGIAGLVLGLIALIFSFIPCLGMYAIFPGVLAIILAAVALMQANKGNGPKGLIIAALIVSLIGTAVAVYQYSVLKEAASAFTGELEGIKENLEELEEAGKDLEDAMRDLENN